MKIRKNTSSDQKVSSSRDNSWFLSSEGKEQLSKFIKKAEKLASAVNESRQIPVSIVKEPFTV